MKSCLLPRLLFILALISAPVALAGPIFLNGATVTSATNQATFDSLTSNGIDLSNYTEDGLRIAVNDTSYTVGTYYDSSHYGISGNNHWVTIELLSGDKIFDLDFEFGDGWGPTGDSNLIWETFVDGSSSGFGDVFITKGTTVGWSDSFGFDSIRVASNFYGIDSFGEYQAIRIENLRVSATPSGVPDHSNTLVLGLLGAGVFCFGRFSRPN